MEIRNKNLNKEEDRKLLPLVEAYRRKRAFSAESYVEQKVALLNRFFSSHGITAGVVGVSGGVDSALVLSLLSLTNLKKIVPLLLPALDNPGATGQDSATDRGKLLCASIGVSPAILDISELLLTFTSGVEQSTGLSSNNWAKGQAVSYLRTPAIYYTTSLLTASGFRGIVAGTTNMDEGAYLGYVGKASDGMVDCQIISDIHKSEVYATAKYLEIPPDIILATPTGDMYDGNTDEEVFGTSYDTVELFYASKKHPKFFQEHLASLDADALKAKDTLFSKLESMHNYNAHKYAAASPAIHLDLWDSFIPGGWQYNVWRSCCE